MSDETPTGDATPPPAPEPAAPAPAAEAPPPAAPAPVAVAAPAEPQKTSKSVAVPMWLLVGIAALIGAVVMFGIGYAVGESGNDDDRSSTVEAPFPGNNPFDDQGRGGTRQTPNQPAPNRPNLPNQQTPSPQTSGAFLGVATQPTAGGLEVTQVVPGSAADDAGIQVGDVITSFDGTDVTTSAQLARAVGSLDPGDTARITYTRNGQTRTVTVELGTRSATNSN